MPIRGLCLCECFTGYFLGFGLEQLAKLFVFKQIEGHEGLAGVPSEVVWKQHRVQSDISVEFFG